MGGARLSGYSGNAFFVGSDPAREARLELPDLGGGGVEGIEPVAYVCGADGLHSMVPANGNRGKGMGSWGCLDGISWIVIDVWQDEATKV